VKAWLSIAVLVFVVLACGHRRPPYKRADKPTPEVLLAAARPQLEAVAVSDATIVFNRVAKGDLAMLAQAPMRFRASVTKAGNELITLAFTEQDYGLRYLLDQMPTGFYQGPADPCAVEAILGVPLSYSDLVAAVLGGAPVIPNHEVVEQTWDGRQEHEKLVIRNDRFVQELQFVWVGNTWRFKGSGVWLRTGDGRGAWLWSLEHSGHQQVGAAVLPEETEVRSPKSKRGRNRVVITYRDRDANPPWAGSGAGGDDEGGDEGGDEGPSAEGGADDWGDEGEWEDQEMDEEGGESAPKTLSQGPGNSNIPGVFQLEASGLPRRGDLCRGR
jgi:hypothetical protein